MQHPHDDKATPVVPEPIELADAYVELPKLILDRPDVAAFLAADAAGGEADALHSQQVPCDKGAPRLVRAWVRDLLHGVGLPDGFLRDGIVHDLVLCASELVNLSLMANSTAITVRLLVKPDEFRFSLVDDRPILTDSADPAFRAQSMCLRVIDASSASFGIVEAALGRELWVLFDRGEPRVAA